MKLVRASSRKSFALASGKSGANGGPRSIAHLQRRADTYGVVSYERFPRSDSGRIHTQQEIERRNYLERLRLAHIVSELSWELSPNHERVLRRQQRSKDVIKSLRRVSEKKAWSWEVTIVAEHRPYRVASWNAKTQLLRVKLVTWRSSGHRRCSLTGGRPNSRRTFGDAPQLGPTLFGSYAPWNGSCGGSR